MILALLLAVDAALQPFVKFDAPALVLEHARVIDGTGAPPRDDQTLFIANGKLASQAAAGAQRIDLTGRTVLPGLVGMHDHLFYPAGGGVFHEMATSFPRLYLAAGVTTIRTTGSIEPYTDIEIKRDVDRGVVPGPKIWITGPYLEGEIPWTQQMHRLHGAAEFRRTVDYWADQGATSFKLYNFLKLDELSAAVDQAHKRRLKITGHLCSVGFTEAARAGIDNLEHGLWVDTEFYSKKKPGECAAREALAETAELSATDPRLEALTQELVKRHVAVTSTLPVFDALAEAGFRRALSPAVLEALSTDTRARLLSNHLGGRSQETVVKMNKLEMAWERAFVKAGGTLLAGCDPTGNGAVLAGYGDQRGVELLVEAGFTPLEALRIASWNGAQFLGQEQRIGSIAPGKDADLVVVKGDPSKEISDIEKVEVVFKDGVGYDPQKLVDSVRGLVGTR
ncbi:MAG TPA: amidohydrolase family protein [Myxococcales bacterium]|jgi:imidazolonepropionase-like amidohydrolase|nr:amidohydrolase family protein [Myxococcales bacterium]